MCLTGGSAFGLAAADGVVDWLEERGSGLPGRSGRRPQGVVPVVPAAVIFDLGRGGRFDRRPDAEFGRRAIASARVRQRSWGSVGAGTGARAGGLQGGVGTASTDGRSIRRAGSRPPLTRAGGRRRRRQLERQCDRPRHRRCRGSPRAFALRRPTARDRQRLLAQLSGQAASLNTTIGVVATSAALSKAEASKMADVAHDGLARAIRPAHSMFDGDTIFGLATGEHDLGIAPRCDALDDRRARARSTSSCTPAPTCSPRRAPMRCWRQPRIGDAAAYPDLCPSAHRAPSPVRAASTSVALRGHRHRLAGCGARMVGRHPLGRSHRPGPHDGSTAPWPPRADRTAARSTLIASSSRSSSTRSSSASAATSSTTRGRSTTTSEPATRRAPTWSTCRPRRRCTPTASRRRFASSGCRI